MKERRFMNDMAVMLAVMSLAFASWLWVAFELAVYFMRYGDFDYWSLGSLLTTNLASLILWIYNGLKLKNSDYENG